MNKKGQWNIGVGTALVILGIYLITRGLVETVIFGAILVGLGTWLITKDIMK